MSLTEELEKKKDSFEKELSALCMKHSVYLNAQARMEYVATPEGDVEETYFEVEL